MRSSRLANPYGKHHRSGLWLQARQSDYFSRPLRDKLLALAGDTGGRAVIEQFPDMVFTTDMPSTDAGLDIDTPDDYKAILQ